jgi:hypothetical protein
MEPLVKTIEVPCDQERAFTVFLDMGSWWPTGRFATSALAGQTVQALRVDARPGGQIVEFSSDGKQLGAVADMVQRGYRQAWVIIFEEAYKAACSARA